MTRKPGERAIATGRHLGGRADADPWSAAGPPAADRNENSLPADLIARIARKDREAFLELYDKTCERLLGYLLRQLGKREEAEDVLQEVYWQVWERAERFQPNRGSPLAWLVLLARSRALDHLRRRERQRLRIQDRESVAVIAEAPEDFSERDESLWRSHRALAALPQTERSLLQLSFLHGMTHAQIAAQASLPLGTVKTRIRQGIQHLREMLGASQVGGAS